MIMDLSKTGVSGSSREEMKKETLSSEVIKIVNIICIRLLPLYVHVAQPLNS